MNDDKLIGVVSELEEQMYESYLHGTKEQLKFLLENQPEPNLFDFRNLLKHAKIDETSERDVTDFSLDAIATPRAKREQFMDEYGVNYEISREFSLQSLAEYYMRKTSQQDEILDVFYKVISQKNAPDKIFITLEHLNEIGYEVNEFVKSTPILNRNSGKYKRVIWNLIKRHLNKYYDTPKNIKKSQIEDFMYYRIIAYIREQLGYDLQTYLKNKDDEYI